MEFGKKHEMSVSFELAKEVTSYFDWDINKHLEDAALEDTWPRVPEDFGNPKNFNWSMKSCVYKEPRVSNPFHVPRFTLTSYQPNWVLSHYSFCEGRDYTDSYLWKNFTWEEWEESWEYQRILNGYTDEEDQPYITQVMHEFLDYLKTQEPHPKILEWFPNPAVMAQSDSDSDDQLFSDDSSKTAMET